MHAAASSMQTLRQALRSSPWIAIAIGLHLVLFAALSIVYVAQRNASVVAEAPPISIRVPLDDSEIFDDPEPMIVRDAIPKDTNVELTSVDVPFPEPDDFAPPADLTQPVGSEEQIGPSDLPPGGTLGSSAFGVSAENNGVRGHGPSPFGGRGNGVSQPGRRPIEKPVVTEAAVLEGLKWLLRHQAEDGSWSAATLADRCTAGRACAEESADFSPQYDPGLTSLALLAFLGRGIDGGMERKVHIVDDVRGKAYVANRQVSEGLQWLIGALAEDGSFKDYSGSLYNEALGALALSEAWGLSHERLLKEPAQRMIRYLVRAQKQSPVGTGRWGWRYTPGGDSIADTSVTGWVVMALKSAELAGLDVPRDAFDGAVDFTHWVTGQDGLVGYLDPAGAGEKVLGRGDEFDYHAGTMSALGMLVRTFTARDIADPFLEAGARRLVADLPALSEDGLSIDYYYWYYGSLALNQFDGPQSPRADRGRYWGPWNASMSAALLSLQDTSKEQGACSRGGWLKPDRWCHAGGPVYATALNVLTLEVYYRYENVFGAGALHKGR
jgi:hypothetical protein